MMEVTCAILAGGKSRRIGKDKATLKLGDRLLINHVYDEARKVFDKIIILSNHHSPFPGIDAPVLPDLFPMQNSIVGILSALLYASTPYVLVIACDMPNLSEKAFEYMVEEIHGEDVIIPRTKSGFEPLHALYNRSCISYFLTSVEKNRFKTTDLFSHLSVRELGEHPSFQHRGHSVFTNINMKEDFQNALDKKEAPVFLIREMKRADIEDVLAIERQSFRSPWSRRLFEEALSSPIAINYVINSGDDIAGYLCLYTVLDEGHILNVAVHPGFRVKGHASRLIAHVIEKLGTRGITRFFLEVREGNDAAIHLYEKYGFAVIGKRKKYYTDTNEDALVMHLVSDNG